MKDLCSDVYDSFFIWVVLQVDSHVLYKHPSRPALRPVVFFVLTWIVVLLGGQHLRTLGAGKGLAEFPPQAPLQFVNTGRKSHTTECFVVSVK